MSLAYTQHAGRAVEDKRFSHLMAIALDPGAQYKKGVIRCITSREGDVDTKGYIDRSELYAISGETPEKFSVGEPLQIKNTKEILDRLDSKEWNFIGLEDPDIFVDDKTGLTHLYFTMPLLNKDKTKEQSLIHLGHAVGKDLNSLEMTMPALQADTNNTAKEVSIAPINSKGIRYNLIESSSIEDKVWYSTVRIGIARSMDKPWEFGETVFHPKEQDIPWIGGHASPGPLFPKSFIDAGEGKLVGIINGREANRTVDDKTVYGMFSVGLFIYDYERGKIDWVSPKPFIQHTEAHAITFVSEIVETKPGEGILYAHLDASFVRAYALYAEGIRAFLP